MDLATTLSLLIGTVLPLIVGLVTQAKTHPAVQGVTLLGLSAATSVLTQWADSANSHTAFTWQPIVIGAVLTFATGVASHYGFWKHTGLPAALQGFPAAKTNFSVAPATGDATPVGEMTAGSMPQVGSAAALPKPPQA